MRINTIIYLLFLILCVPAYAQENLTIALIDKQLLIVNVETPTLLPLVGTTLPSDAVTRRLTYHSELCLLFFIVLKNDDPYLYSTDLQGNINEVGLLSVPGATVSFIEGFAYNQATNSLYGGASLNGDQSIGDYYSETLIDIDPLTAEATIVSTMQAGATVDTDIDAMCIENNTMYVVDVRSDIYSAFYEVSLDNIGNSFAMDELVVVDGMRSYELTCVGNTLYSVGDDFGLHSVEVGTNNYNYIGQTHVGADFNGSRIDGVASIEVDIEDQLETYLGCEGDGYNYTSPNGNVYNEDKPSGIELVPGIDYCYARLVIDLSFSPTDCLGNCEEDQTNAPLPGTPCDDENPETELDVYQEDCTCLGLQITVDESVSDDSAATPGTSEAGDITDLSAALDFEVIFPSGFTPNSDGVNDFFRPISESKLSYNIRIFNRWGNEIAKFDDSSVGWDGKQARQEADIGSYVYVAKYRFFGEDEWLSKKGSITLIR